MFWVRDRECLLHSILGPLIETTLHHLPRRLLVSTLQCAAVLEDYPRSSIRIRGLKFKIDFQ